MSYTHQVELHTVGGYTVTPKVFKSLLKVKTSDKQMRFSHKPASRQFLEDVLEEVGSPQVHTGCPSKATTGVKS